LFEKRTSTRGKRILPLRIHNKRQQRRERAGDIGGSKAKQPIESKRAEEACQGWIKKKVIGTLDSIVKVSV